MKRWFFTSPFDELHPLTNQIVWQPRNWEGFYWVLMKIFLKTQSKNKKKKHIPGESAEFRVDVIMCWKLPEFFQNPHIDRNVYYSVFWVMLGVYWIRLIGSNKEPWHCKPILRKGGSHLIITVIVVDFMASRQTCYNTVATSDEKTVAHVTWTEGEYCHVDELKKKQPDYRSCIALRFSRSYCFQQEFLISISDS